MSERLFVANSNFTHLAASNTSVMPRNYIEDQTFEQINFQEQTLVKGEYENCEFKQCDFANADLSGFKFSECRFLDCNLSMIRLDGTALREVQFRDCKMLGLHLDACDPFGLSLAFERCQLNHTSFFQMNLKKTVFQHCKLEEADFTEADLSGAIFEHCDLKRAVFDHTRLEKADFRTAINYTIHPETNQIKHARFSLPDVVGLLEKYEIRIERL